MKEPSSLTVRRLYSAYQPLRTTTEGAGSEKLSAISDLAWSAFAETQGSRRTVLFVLAELFEDFSAQVDGEPITADFSTRCFSLIDRPVISALDWLSGDDPISDPMTIANALTSAYAHIRAAFQA